MRFTTTVFYLVACLTAPATARSIFTPAAFPGEDHKIPGESSLYLCEGNHDSDILQISKIDLAPNPPKAGTDLVITATGSISKKVDEGSYAKVVVKLGLIRLISRDFDLCEQVTNVNLSCPLDVGEISLTTTVSLPKEIPPAKFNVVADVYSEEDEPVTCVTANVDFMPKRVLGAYEDNEDL